MINVLIGLAQAQADKILRSPRTLQLLADPRVQKKLMQLITLRADLRQKVSGTVQDFAKSYSIATRDDMAKVRRTMREMERTIAALQKELANLREEEELQAKAEKKPKKASRKAASTAKTTKKG